MACGFVEFGCHFRDARQAHGTLDVDRASGGMEEVRMDQELLDRS